MNKALWVIQDNLNCDDKILLPILEKNNIPYILINIVPFLNQIPNVNYLGPKIVRASTTILRHIEQKNWEPGVWHNENFKPSWYKDCFGNDYLNKEGKLVKLMDLPSEWKNEGITYLFDQILIIKN